MSAYVGPIRRVETAKGHHYVDANKRRVPGVTTITGDGLPKPALINWAGNATADYAIDHWAELGELSPAARLAKLRGGRYETRDAAANRGTQVHALADQLIRGVEVDVPEELAGHVESYVHFLDEFGPDPLLIEGVVFSHSHGYAGTLDLIADFPTLGQRLLVDLKGLALDTPIPTPSGWTTMAAVRVGDQVFAADGSVCNVVAKSSIHVRDCHRMEFDDGTSIVCDDEHRWPVISGRSTKRERHVHGVLTAAEIAGSLRHYGQHHHRIPVAGPLQTPPAELHIDPYVLGCWLGDGAKDCGLVTKPDDELFDLIAARGYQVGEDISSRDRCQSKTVYGLRTQLRQEGLLGHKSVPDINLRGAIGQRLDLLRGLMDTDGTYNRARNQVVFTSTDKALACAARELALGLGERAVIHEVTGLGFGRLTTSWSVVWRPQRFVPFLLSRKANLVALTPSARSGRRLIMGADRTVTVPTQCIAVDSIDRTYLCGEQMVPTHNTNRTGIYGETALQLAGYRYADTHLNEHGVERPMIQVDGCAAVHVRADGFDLIPVTAGPEQHRDLLYAQQIKRFTDESRDLVGSPIPPPSRVQRRRMEIVPEETP